ncbi:ribosome biogenesis GTP-binding protein YihA/YsxC [Mycoplasma sp. 1654_15]|uniref:ribosome biogenesis GTP-binding protein YihA/YsxC n=1 Tax=Mycoplasma sp. 1654_15 TaxID=2725994 RepID=UPI001449CE24|nr:ribosome biogenesis GTP-binding protein YihA/YsxC [Mycoplasma sp. 1654_15]QJB71293.1 YihA family ribosome biogenesis GTP-binding protein [Mycoplasma sp. 1654_15]
MWSFIKSASAKSSWFEHNQQEISFIGRSNVGKSSLINALANQKIAKTSKQPGRTQLLNFFYNEQKKVIVDLPGYGFAKISISQKSLISSMLRDYFENRSNLKTVFVLVDSNVGITELDLKMLEFLKQLNKEVVLVATKIDKINQSQKHKIIKSIDNLGYPYFLISSSKKIGIDKLNVYINNLLS